MRDRLDSTGHSFQAYFKRATSPLVVLRLLMEKIGRASCRERV